MTSNGTREALRGNDDNLAMALLTEIMNTTDLDSAIALLERIKVGERANTVEDIVIDLTDFGQAEAAGIVKVNY